MCFVKELGSETGQEISLQVIIDEETEERDAIEITSVSIEKLLARLHKTKSAPKNPVRRTRKKKTRRTIQAKDTKITSPSQPDPAIETQIWQTTMYFAKFSKKEKGRQDFAIDYQGARYILRNVSRKTARCVAMALEEAYEVQIKLYGISPKGKPTLAKNGGKIIRQEVAKYFIQKEAAPRRGVVKAVRKEKPAKTFLPSDQVIETQVWSVAERFTKFSRNKELKNLSMIFRGAIYPLNEISLKSARCIVSVFEQFYEEEVSLYSGKKRINCNNAGVAKAAKTYLQPGNIRINVSPDGGKAATHYCVANGQIKDGLTFKEFLKALKEACAGRKRHYVVAWVTA